MIELETQNQLDKEYEYYQTEYKRKTLRFNKEEKKTINRVIPTYPNPNRPVSSQSTPIPRVTDSLLHPSQTKNNYRGWYKGIFCVLYIILLIIGFVIGNMLLGKQRDNCEDNFPSIYTKVNVTTCSIQSITYQYGNYTCLIKGEDFSCNFPNNTAYIYVSQNHKNCAAEYRINQCSDDLVLFNIMMVIFSLCYFCMGLSTPIHKNNRRQTRNIIDRYNRK